MPVVASITRPIYEDTRVKIALDLGAGIDRNDLSVTIRDNEGDHAFEHGSFPANYRHIFRVPNQKDYTARVVYRHPVSKDSQEIINVQIPVLKMSFANRTVETSGARTDDPDLSGRAGDAGSSGGRDSSSAAATGWGARTGSIRHDADAGGEGATYDMSDLYTDPANPPEVAGDRSGAADESSSRATETGHGVGEAPQTGGTSPTDAKTAFGDVQSGSSGRTADTGRAGARKTTRAGTTDSEAAGAGTSQDGSGGSSVAGSSDGSAQAGESGSSGASAGQRQGGDGSAGTESPALADTAAAQDTSYAMAQEGDVDGSTSTSPVAGADRAKNAGGVTTASGRQEEKPYLLSVSIQNRATNGAQSFDFNIDPAPTAQSISPQTPLAISVDFAQSVLRDSVKIEIFDGRDRITTSPVEMKTGVVEHIFENQTTEAYVWVYGRTDQGPFSYKILIPVTGL
ncbi:MAG TPA: hypothetical protein PLY73_01495 [Candidatus Ozemobacteraceae bacterium]|nr:hypothetical protein [Candidatus Ozemobacteraceae bacterium]